MTLYDIPNDNGDRRYHAEVTIVIKTAKAFKIPGGQDFGTEAADTIVRSSSDHKKEDVVQDALEQIALALSESRGSKGRA